jgi:copper chaperone
MVKLKVENMSCGHCAATVHRAVKSVDPAAEVQVDLAGGTVSINSSAGEAQVSEAIREAGYPNSKLAA